MRSTVLSGYFWTAVAIIAVLFVACALLVLPALAQDGEAPPEIGSEVDAFLLLALPAMVLIQTAIIQAAKWLFPNTVVSTETLARVVKGIFAIVYIGAWIAGAQDQLVGGVTFINELSDPVLKLLGLIGMWIGPSALHEWADANRPPLLSVLGRSQGMDIGSFARDKPTYQRTA